MPSQAKAVPHGLVISTLSPRGLPTFEMYCHDVDNISSLTPQTKATVYWTGAAFTAFSVEMFDRLRNIIFARDGFTYCFVTATGQVDGGDAFYEDAAVLGVEPTPFSIPESVIRLRLNFYGRSGSPPDEFGFAIPTFANQDIGVTFWGDVYRGPSAPSSQSNRVGVYSDAAGLFRFESQLANYIATTQYGTVGYSEIETELKALWAAFKIAGLP